MKSLNLSILDQSPVREHGTARQALKETVLLAQRAEELGYKRFWVSEHHNTTGLAGSAPEVLIAHLAAHTSTIRLGSGGIMLPNHSALKMAENFRILEAFAPGRIDMGIGRAPGGDRLTAALLNPSNRFREEEYMEQLNDLTSYFGNGLDTSYGKVVAIPAVDTAPEMWLLTSSGSSAVFAAGLGMGLAFAQFISPYGAQEAIALYRQRFKPSAAMPEPKVLLAISVLIGETQEKAEQLKAVMQNRLLQLERGNRLEGIPSYESIKDIPYTPEDLLAMQRNTGRMIAGTPDQVKAQLLELAETCQVDEIMAVTITHSFEDRLRSYELLAEMFPATQEAATV
jgi:luciferase family oxidoreductase group 1